MRTDRYTKVVLTIIAIGLWALTMTQFELPEAQAGTGQIEQERQERRDTEPATPHAPVSTKPLRYRIPYARHRNTTTPGYPDCMTAVSIVNVGPASTYVDVEFFNGAGTSLGIGTLLVDPGEPDVSDTDTGVESTPIFINQYVGTGSFDGYALVNSDDPRIVVTAMMRCGENDAPVPSTINSIPAFPVGATAEYFQAGMPSTWTPPMVTPELPE